MPSSRRACFIYNFSILFHKPQRPIVKQVEDTFPCPPAFSAGACRTSRIWSITTAGLFSGRNFSGRMLLSSPKSAHTFIYFFPDRDVIPACFVNSCSVSPREERHGVDGVVILGTEGRERAIRQHHVPLDHLMPEPAAEAILPEPRAHALRQQVEHAARILDGGDVPGAWWCCFRCS